METSFGKETLPVWCEGCKQEGHYFVDDYDQSLFVVCERCGWETSYVWCSRCEMGGGFVENLKDHPLSWVCPGCKRAYPLSSDFYKKPVTLYLESHEPSKPGIQIPKRLFVVPYLGVIAGIVWLGGNTVEGICAAALVGAIGLAMMVIPGHWYVELPADIRSKTDRVVAAMAISTIGCLLLVAILAVSLAMSASPVWRTLDVLFIVGFSLFLIWIIRREREARKGN